MKPHRTHYLYTSPKSKALCKQLVCNIALCALGTKSDDDDNGVVMVMMTLIAFYPYTSGASPGPSHSLHTSTSSIYASWKEIVAEKWHGIMQGYKLFFYEFTKDGLRTKENRTYQLSVLETTFTELKTYTKYRIEVLGFNNFGDGPAAAVEVRTAEGIPSEAPSNFTANNKKFDHPTCNVEACAECCQFGIILGYHVTLTDSSNSSATITKTVTELYSRFTNLKKYHVYQLSVDAFTSKGIGPNVPTSASTDQDRNGPSSVDITVKTEEEAPQVSPATFEGINSSSTSIVATLGPNPRRGSCRSAKKIFTLLIAS
ncbi:hypothetical protein OS493_007290 [Desmophyllum pertusum]|uniref:Fibronectin type-III domain-containing protein n=1 Tax=Desmophyllum pertusum TaxID=174260 RepID=A0A9X0CST8_9CNID|nr:hypothetical protein OS493_007290 [Desmophyllum pertusum]